MLKKQLVLVFVACLVVHSIGSEEVLFRMLEDTLAWKETRGAGIIRTYSTVTRIIPEGALISNPSSPRIGPISGSQSFFHIGVRFEDGEYHIPANSFTAIDTEEIFNDSFLTSADPEE